MTNADWLDGAIKKHATDTSYFFGISKEMAAAILKELLAADSLASVVDGSTEEEAAKLEAYKRSQK